jgi:hypothetical protein
MRPRNSPLILAILVSLSAGGCFNNTPSQANIELRKQNQQLQDQLAVLDRRHSADEATIRGLQANATTVPMLPQDELDQLFTTAGLKFGSLTGGYHPDPNQYGDTMVKVYVCPIDQDGNKITATGTSPCIQTTASARGILTSSRAGRAGLTRCSWRIMCWTVRGRRCPRMRH